MSTFAVTATAIAMASGTLLVMGTLVAILLACLGLWNDKMRRGFVHLYRVGLLGLLLGGGGCIISAISTMP